MISSSFSGGSAAYAQVSQQETSSSTREHHSGNHNNTNDNHNSNNDADDLEAHLTTRPYHWNATARQSTFTHIPQARHLTWRDDFYDGKHGMVAVFDRHGLAAGNVHLIKYGMVAVFFWMAGIVYWMLGASIDATDHDLSIMDDIFGVYMWALGGLALLRALRARQAQLAQHVAVTTEGIRIDSGSMVCLIIPFEHIVHVQINTTRPKLSCCWKQVWDNLPPIVTIQRTAAPLEQVCPCTKTRKMELYGILRAQEFVDLVMAMKDSQDNGTYEGAVGGGAAAASSHSAVATLSSALTASTSSSNSHQQQQHNYNDVELKQVM